MCRGIFYGLFPEPLCVSELLLGYFFFAVGVIVSGQIGRYDVDPGVLHEMYILALLLMALAFWRHRQNIVRLIRGNENKIYLGKH